MDAQRNQEFLQDTRLEARDAAAHVIAMWEAHPETVMPSTLIAALAALREAIK